MAFIEFINDAWRLHLQETKMRKNKTFSLWRQPWWHVMEIRTYMNCRVPFVFYRTLPSRFKQEPLTELVRPSAKLQLFTFADMWNYNIRWSYNTLCYNSIAGIKKVMKTKIKGRKIALKAMKGLFRSDVFHHATLLYQC